ncbi:MAG: S8 family serine peptidase, partial [Minisyncoccota bacterium]
MESFGKKQQSQAESPERLIEEGKNPGLGIRKLHEQGITGAGIVVGIIDQRISPTHAEFKDNIVSNKEYYSPESADDTEVSMHGPAVVSLLAGKECGVAPDTKVVYGN